ncbi:MAG: S26 family signal peptidase [Spirochaetes bacterium]|nr:S26 family signal peptidase [Spirochaetota bacterium]
MSKYASRKKAGTSAPRLGLGLALGILLFLLIRSSFLDLALASGNSMMPGIKEGDIVLIFKAAYGLRQPGGGYLFLWSRPKNREIVAAIKPVEGTMLIKRVSEERESPALRDPVFLMGDNIYASLDSREFGAVPMNNILGRAFPISGP